MTWSAVFFLRSFPPDSTIPSFEVVLEPWEEGSFFNCFMRYRANPFADGRGPTRGCNRGNCPEKGKANKQHKTFFFMLITVKGAFVSQMFDVHRTLTAMSEQRKEQQEINTQQKGTKCTEGEGFLVNCKICISGRKRSFFQFEIHVSPADLGFSFWGVYSSFQRRHLLSWQQHHCFIIHL